MLTSLPPRYTHTRILDKENTHPRMQRHASEVKIFPCEEGRNQKNRRSSVKLESKKQGKKVAAEWVEGREVPMEL